MKISRSWLMLTQGEKLAVLRYAVSINKARWQK